MRREIGEKIERRVERQRMERQRRGESEKRRGKREKIDI